MNTLIVESIFVCCSARVTAFWAQRDSNETMISSSTDTKMICPTSIITGRKVSAALPQLGSATSSLRLSENSLSSDTMTGWASGSPAAELFAVFTAGPPAGASFWIMQHDKPRPGLGLTRIQSF